MTICGKTTIILSLRNLTALISCENSNSIMLLNEKKKCKQTYIVHKKLKKNNSWNWITISVFHKFFCLLLYLVLSKKTREIQFHEFVSLEKFVKFNYLCLRSSQITILWDLWRGSLVDAPIASIGPMRGFTTNATGLQRNSISAWKISKIPAFKKSCYYIIYICHVYVFISFVMAKVHLLCTMCDFHNFVSFLRDNALLPQRLKLMFFENFSSGGCPKRRVPGVK